MKEQNLKVDIFEGLDKFTDAVLASLDGENMEPGDTIVVVGTNCTVIFDMNEEQELKVNVVGGKPLMIDAGLAFFEVEEGEAE